MANEPRREPVEPEPFDAVAAVEQASEETKRVKESIAALETTHGLRDTSATDHRENQATRPADAIAGRGACDHYWTVQNRPVQMCGYCGVHRDERYTALKSEAATLRSRVVELETLVDHLRSELATRAG
jgi:hypothetical protein